jgi:outer membrane protein OmpA-like peptidoglycan-associated protein
MNRNSSAYLFCIVLIMIVFCSVVPGVTMENGPGVASKGDKCLLAKEKYNEGVQLLNYEARRAAFQKAVDLCPSYAEAHVNLADALEKLGLGKRREFEQQSQTDSDKLLEGAEQHYSIAVKLKPELIAPQIGLGDVYVVQGRYPLAVERYENILKSQPMTQGVKERLNEARRLADSDSKNKKAIKYASDITKEVKDSNLEGTYKVMGIENFTVPDTARQSFNNILFDGWSSTIKPGDPINQLNEIGKALSSSEMASYKFLIEGHANTIGEFEPNLNLSNRRAAAVKDYLVRHFPIAPDHILTKGYGFTRPKHEPGNDPRNRRVEVVFVK